MAVVELNASTAQVIQYRYIVRQKARFACLVSVSVVGRAFFSKAVSARIFEKRVLGYPLSMRFVVNFFL